MHYPQDPPPDQPKPRTTRMGVRLAAGIVGGLVVASAFIYIARRPLASWFIERYLADRGIESSIAIERLGFGGAVVQIRLGPEKAPDLTVQRLAAAFAWRGLKPHLESADLRGLTLRVRYDGKVFSLGALQALIGTTTNRNAPADATPAPINTGPTITAEDAKLWIETPAGTLRVSGFANFARGRVRTLYASAEPVTLKRRDLTAELRSAVLSEDPHGNLHAAVSGGFTAVDNQQRMAANGLSATARITGLSWYMQADGSLRIAARMQAQLDANEIDAQGMIVTGAQAHLEAAGTFDTDGNAGVTGTLTASGAMPANRADAEAASIPVLGSDPAYRRAFATALEHFGLRINGFHVLRSVGQTYVTLAEPVEISGGDAVLSLSTPSGPLAHAVAGVVRGTGKIILSSAHLPNVVLTVPSYTWQSTAAGGDEFEADADIRAAFGLRTVRGVAIAAKGGMRWRDHAFVFVPDGCADVRIAALVQKTRRVAGNAAARLCGRPGGGFLSVRPGGWSVNAQWQSLSLHLPSASAKLTSAGGTIALMQHDGSLDGNIDVAEARLSDLAHTRRFAPIAASGRMTISDDILHGRIALSGAKQKRLASIAAVHDIHTGRGHADIRAKALSFSPDHAQPVDLSPMLASLAQATGETGFTGRIAWTPRGMTSGGELQIRNLDFVSPLGRVHNARGQVQFTSLVPLHTASKQEIAVAKVDWATPLTNLSAAFDASPAVLQLHGAKGSLAEGHVRLGPLSYSLSPGATTAGEITIHNVDAGALVSASNLAGKIKLSARVSGTVPFRYGLEGLRFAGGHIATVGPGTLSIARSLWSGAETNAGSGAIRDFAYQALEQLAIDRMDGTVNSLPNGRLNIVLHIKGRHEPVTAKPAEIGIFALVQGRALDKPIPLPKGTEVNLTLDTSLNFDELLAAYRKAWTDSLAKTAAEPATHRGRSSK